jgi:hypothetical protein
MPPEQGAMDGQNSQQAPQAGSQSSNIPTNGRDQFNRLPAELRIMVRARVPVEPPRVLLVVYATGQSPTDLAMVAYTPGNRPITANYHYDAGVMSQVN